MRRPYKPYIAQTIGELSENLGWMMLNSSDVQGSYRLFPGSQHRYRLPSLNDSLANLRGKLGEERYAKMREMSDQMRALFESDPEGATGGRKAGRQIIHEMELMLRRKWAAAPE